MRIFLLVGISFLFIMISLAFAEPYWGNLKVDLEKQERIEGETNDVIRVKAKLTNEDREEIFIYHSFVVLEDSKNRQFSSSSWAELNREGFRVTEKECPLEFALRINPSISEETGFCYIVPKDHVEYVLHFYESSPDYCKRPSFGSCQEKSVKLIISPPASSQIQRQSSQSDSMAADMKTLHAKITELEKKIKSLEKQISELKDKLAAKDKKISDLTKQMLKDKKSKKK